MRGKVANKSHSYKLSFSDPASNYFRSLIRVTWLVGSFDGVCENFERKMEDESVRFVESYGGGDNAKRSLLVKVKRVDVNIHHHATSH